MHFKFVSLQFASEKFRNENYSSSREELVKKDENAIEFVGELLSDLLVDMLNESHMQAQSLVESQT